MRGSARGHLVVVPCDVASMDSYWDGFAAEVDAVFTAHPGLDDHRGHYPWLLGALGEPTAPVWFLAENPSLNQVRSAGQERTPEAQWSESRGDALFRNALIAVGLKDGGPMAAGGWRCYVTDVVKSASVAGDWGKLPKSERQRVARAWASVLAYELTAGTPKVLIVLGDAADGLLKHLRERRLVPADPPAVRVAHYSYLAMRPETSGLRRPQGHPDRIREWQSAIRRAAEPWNSVTE